MVRCISEFNAPFSSIPCPHMSDVITREVMTLVERHVTMNFARQLTNPEQSY